MSHTDTGAELSRFLESSQGREPITIIDSRAARVETAAAARKATSAQAPRPAPARDVSEQVIWNERMAATKTAQPIARKAAPLVRGKDAPAQRGPESVADADSIFGAIAAASAANRLRRSAQR
jgi:hypothetical protein